MCWNFSARFQSILTLRRSARNRSVPVLDADWSSDADGKSDYDNNILYCGYYYDSETGLYHVRNRVYHPLLGLWLQRDPSGYQDGAGLYEYVMSAPIVSRDPFGEMTEDECFKALANEINNLTSLAGQLSAHAQRMGRDRGDAGRASRLVSSSEEEWKWRFKVHYVGDSEEGDAGVHYVVPIGSVSRKNYANVLGNPRLCRGIGTLIETNIHEAIHQKQQGISMSETLDPPREWKPGPDPPAAAGVGGGPQRRVENYAGQIADDVSSVLNLDAQEKNSFRPPPGKCCCEVLLEMAKRIKDREIARYPYWK